MLIIIIVLMATDVVGINMKKIDADNLKSCQQHAGEYRESVPDSVFRSNNYQLFYEVSAIKLQKP